MRKIYSGRNNTSEPFIFVVNTRTQDSPSTSAVDVFVLPISQGVSPYGNIAFNIDWGDGQTTNLNSSNFATARTHVYSVAGTYQITCTGNIRGWKFFGMPNGSQDAYKLTEIVQWGDFRVDGTAQFRGCANLVNAGRLDTPIFENPDGGFQMFLDCTALKIVGNIKGWNVSKLTKMQQMFKECDNLNEGIWPTGPIDMSTWDVSNVTNMQQMFSCASSPTGIFNGKMFTLTNTTTDISNMFRNQQSFTNSGQNTINLWDTSNVTSMTSMFRQASAFDSDISGWNTANCTSFSNMFRGGTTTVMAFNQPIGLWDTSSGNSFDQIFTFCNSFQQSLANWDLSGVLSATPIANNSGGGNFNIGLNNYNNLLIAWDAYTYPSWIGSTFNFGASQYSSNNPAAVTAHNNLVIKWGGIIDGGSTP